MLDDVKQFQAQMARDQSSFNLEDQLTLGGYCGEEEQDTIYLLQDLWPEFCPWI